MTTEQQQHQQLNRALREYSRALHSKSLSTRGYDAWAREHGKPRLWRVWRESTWAECVRAAGMQPRQEWRWEHDDLLTLVRDIAEDLGRGPFQREYNERRAAAHPTAPAANSIVRRLGIGWPDICRLALEDTDLEYSERFRRSPVRRSSGAKSSSSRTSKRANVASDHGHNSGSPSGRSVSTPQKSRGRR